MASKRLRGLGKSLMARPFAADRLRFTGEAAPIVQDVATFSGGELAALECRTKGR
jgi:hypothetical protein